jgi:hypothetical protein
MSDENNILCELLSCAEAWEPDARLVGNLRAADIRTAVQVAISALAEVERLRGEDKGQSVDAKRPAYTPEQLVGALQDRIHPTSGRLIDAHRLVTSARDKIVVFVKVYDGESIIDLPQDASEAVLGEYNPAILQVPQQDGFWQGKFKLTLEWEP